MMKSMLFSCKILRVRALPVPAEGDSSAGRALSPAPSALSPACELMIRMMIISVMMITMMVMMIIMTMMTMKMISMMITAVPSPVGVGWSYTEGQDGYSNSYQALSWC